MADSNDWVALLLPFKQAFAFVGTASGGVMLSWAYSWWTKRGNKRDDADAREEQKTQHAIDRLDDRQKAEFDRLDARIIRLETENERLREDNVALQQYGWHMRGYIYDMQQLAESAIRQNTGIPAWKSVPLLERRL